MSLALPRILVVDDEPLNLEIISEYLNTGDYATETAEDGVTALAKLEEAPETYDVILLDRMMPNMDGMETLSLIKKHPILKQIPVIFQTARAASSDIVEGMKAGAYYYLTKPFEEEMLLSIVNTAAQDRKRYHALVKELEESKRPLGLMENGRFKFRTLEEARSLAALIANACPKPQSVVMGLSELLINAVEHGNLGISYTEKTELMDSGSWLEEVESRLDHKSNINKYVDLEFKRSGDRIILRVADQGIGFDWKKYLKMSAERCSDNHGRGIAIAAAVSFSSIEYQGNGNELLAYIEVPELTTM